MILKLDYTQEDLKKLEELYTKYCSFPSHDFAIEEVADTWEKIITITEKVENAALEYYKAHLNELVIDIQDEFKFAMACASSNNPEHELSERWLRFAKFNIRDFINLLDLIDNQAKQKALHEIDLAYQNRKSIIGSTEVNRLIESAKQNRKARPEKLLRVSNNDYAFMRQGVLTNTLTQLKSNSKNIELNKMTGTATMKRGNLTVSFEKFSEIIGLRTSTHKLLDALMIEFTETGGRDTEITLPLKKYMELRGLKNERSAREQVEADLETLFNAKITFTEKLRGKKTADFLDARLVINKGIRRGIIYCTFNPIFHEYMLQHGVMLMAKKALALDDRYHPHCYYIIKKLLEHKCMNFYKSNSNIISVKSLLEAAPGIPTYDEVAAHDRHYERQIITPFENEMDSLEEKGLIKWEYCHSNELPLSDDELEKMDYYTFSKLLIKFELIGYPERELKQLPNSTKSQRKRALGDTK
ncbi:MAG: hypothetical protein IJ520_00170 [Synergistaceae bacterium]|nr:hypothetical protein [Synergistaceae bacterium]MBQ8691544.1 hypothetical protein [Synergistaceae bacterium]